jgi:hypothetical protein
MKSDALRGQELPVSASQQRRPGYRYSMEFRLARTL